MEAATLEAPAPVPPPSIADILVDHLDHAQQKKIAVENLSSMKFLIAPDGTSAVSAKPLPSDKHRQIVEESLKAVSVSESTMPRTCQQRKDLPTS